MAEPGAGGDFDVNQLKSVQPPGSGAVQSGHPSPQTTETPTRIVKRRNRIPVSCHPCRVRRSKCDRGHPCGQCDKRGEAAQCVYAKAIDKNAKAGHQRPSGSQAQTRLNQLEEMILQLVQREHVGMDPASAHEAPRPLQQPYDYVTPAAENEQPLAPPQGVDDAKPHWSSMLHQLLSHVNELRAVLDRGDAMSEAEDGVLDLQDKPVLLGASHPSSLDAVLPHEMPQRQDVDRRLGIYFRATSLVLPIIHSGQFSSEYSQFWDSSAQAADPAWVAVLFGILSLSTLLTMPQDPEGESIAHDRFVTAAAHCIHIAGYTKPRRHLIPALLLLAQSIYANKYDPSREIALIISMVSRLGFESGLHREPGPNYSPFEAEMRRRQWVMIKHFDVQLACQFGVASSIPYNSFDTTEPRNLQDVDMREDMKELPQARPEDEPTNLAVFLIKSKLINVFLEVYHYATAVVEPSDEDVMRLDEKTRRAQAEVPERWKPRAISQAFGEPEEIIMSSLTIECLALKTLCILHRRRMVRGDEYSKGACVDAAMKIVSLLVEFTPELQPGGHLEGRTWMITSTVVNDFLLGVMVMCMSLSVEQRTSDSKGTGRSRDKEEQLDLLEKVRELCVELRSRSRAVERVLGALEALLPKFGREVMVNPSLMPEQAASAILALNGMAYTQGQMTMPSQQQPTPASMSSGSSYPLPTPGPSSALSHERSTTNGGYGPADARFDSPSQPQAIPGFQGQGAPAPSLDYGMGQQQGQQQFINPALQQQPAVDPFDRIIGPSGNQAEIDWTAFDQFINAADHQGWNSQFGLV